jgi:glycosyltransferase involved in cell wall biosynthesis
VPAAPLGNIEIVVVDDGSTDGTTDVLKEKVSSVADRIIYQPRNRGKGAALRAGFAAATGDVIVVQDADLEYNPSDYPVLLEPIFSGKADAVFGSRFMGGRPHRVLYFWHMVGNRFLTLLSNMFTNLNLTDLETCYKGVRAPLLKNLDLRENRFGFESEVTAKLAKAGCRIYEVGISYNGRTYSEGKKVSWKDGVRAIYSILRYNLFP